MLIYPMTGMGYSVLPASNNFWFWWFDESVKLGINLWFMPYVIIGSLDEWQKLGITLNGARPIPC